MKGYRFYLEYETETKKRKATRKDPGEHMGTVIAIPLNDGNYIPWRVQRHGAGTIAVTDAITSVQFFPNSPVCSSSISIDYLRKCKHIPEAMAREIHPALFSYLEA